MPPCERSLPAVKRASPSSSEPPASRSPREEGRHGRQRHGLLLCAIERLRLTAAELVQSLAVKRQNKMRKRQSDADALEKRPQNGRLRQLLSGGFERPPRCERRQSDKLR